MSLYNLDKHLKNIRENKVNFKKDCSNFINTNELTKKNEEFVKTNFNSKNNNIINNRFKNNNILNHYDNLKYFNNEEKGDLLKSCWGNGNEYFSLKKFDHRRKQEEVYNKKLPNIRVKNYQTEKERIKNTINNNKMLYLEQELYIGRNEKNIGRVDDRKNNLGDKLIYKYKNEKDRINNEIKKNSGWDYSKKDNDFYYHPNWKVVNKTKWKGKNTFDLYAKNFGTDKSSWVVNPKILYDCKYIDGSDRVGLINTEKVRNKEKEISKKEFNNYTRNDIWDSVLHISNSNRTFSHNELLGISQIFSQELDKLNIDDKKLEPYIHQLKKIGKNFIFKHSNNIYGKEIEKQYLNEKISKLYLKTLREIKYTLNKDSNLPNNNLKSNLISKIDDKKKLNDNISIKKNKSNKESKEKKLINKMIGIYFN